MCMLIVFSHVTNVVLLGCYNVFISLDCVVNAEL